MSQDAANTVMIVGSGGREHALALALAKSPHVARLLLAPGNPAMIWGVSKLIDFLVTPVAATPDFLNAVRTHSPDLIIIGPEAPLAEGIVDTLSAEGFLTFGPTQAAAQLEASKAFAKSIMKQAGVQTAHFEQVTASDTPDQIDHKLNAFKPPYVIKVDGLAAGKGVTVTEDRQQAWAAIQEALTAGVSPVLIEQFLPGQELSVLAVCDGERAILLPPAQDYKRLRNHQQGPNTGGMGAMSPVPWVTRMLLQRVLHDVIDPVLKTMADRGTPYRGVLYAGLMIDDIGKISVVEFNCRLGDPETQVVLPLTRFDLFELFSAAAHGDLSAMLSALNEDPLALAFPEDTAITVVLAAPGYPERVQTGIDVSVSLEKFPPNVWPLSAGLTQSDDNQRWVSAGGRVLNLVSKAPTLQQARSQVYAANDHVTFPGAQWRSDIGEGQKINTLVNEAPLGCLS